jgi:lysozyme family protein
VGARTPPAAFQARFQVIDVIGDIIRREGGFVDNPADKGGPTFNGVTLKTFSAWLGHQATIEELKHISENDVRSIYTNEFLVAPGFMLIHDERLRSLVLDCSVNHGPQNAVKLLQRALGVKDDGEFGSVTKQALLSANFGQLYLRLCAERVRFYGHIVHQNPSQTVFIEGWLNRAASFIEQA